MTHQAIHKILTIAGTDPTAGAGIQADLKTIGALGSYGCSVITAVVAQNTCGVQSALAMPAKMVAQQLSAVFQDVAIDAVKIGMLANAEIIEQVIATLEHSRPAVVVLDTVMQAKSGDALLTDQAIEVLRKLIPHTDLITPNLMEAAKLLATRPAETEAEMQQQGEALLALGCPNVLLKGGHLPSAQAPDWLFSQQGSQRFSTNRTATHHTHGTGCTLSAALATLYPRYQNWSATLTTAKHWLTGALTQAEKLNVGQGQGPLHHLHQYW